MKHHILKHFTIPALLLSISLSAHARMANQNDLNLDIARNTFFDRMMTTITPTAKISGPVFVNDSEAKSQYAKELMKIILQEADKVASRYKQAGDYQAYNAFLVLALTVPLQEGLYMQFRHVYDNPTLCNQHSSSGNILFAPSPEKLAKKYTAQELEEKKANSTVYKNFIKIAKSGKTPFFPDCENFRVDDGPVTQIIRGYDGSDMGMMQLSMRWHYDEFYAKKEYLSVRQTVRYGLKHLMRGFKPVLANQKKYKCLRKGGLFKKKKFSYLNLIRGTWAGKYNSGSIAKTCRFADFNSPYKSHDKGFMENLTKVLNYDQNYTIGAGNSLGFKVDEETHQVLKEVIQNFKNKTNNRTQLSSFIQS